MDESTNTGDGATGTSGNGWRFGIRLKFLGILVVAAVVPVIIGLSSISYLGTQKLTTNEGQLYATMAREMAVRIEQSIGESLQTLEVWLRFSGLGDDPAFSEEVSRHAPWSKLRFDEVEAIWPELDSDGEIMRKFLASDLAQRLREIQNAYLIDGDPMHPLFVEIFVTDRRGRLLAATQKTSDYWQADESWWLMSADNPPGEAWLEGVDLDESAGVLSLDVSLPIYSSDSSKPVGVLKAVLDSTRYFESLAAIARNGAGNPDFKVVLGDGSTLVDLGGSAERGSNIHFDEEIMTAIRSSREEWMVVEIPNASRQLTGFAPLTAGREDDEINASGLKPMHVIVHNDLSTVRTPVYRELRRVALGGGILVALFAILGFLIARYEIIRPLRILERAARAMAARSSGDEGTKASRATDDRAAEKALRAVDEIRTHDELEGLANVFAAMARRVLNYHVQLEAEILHRTREVAADLLMAREFQQALLPREYPIIQPDVARSSVGLEFHHVYQPAMSVGGDFFDTVRLDENRAAVFLADVMGHGARAALITAILRTLFQDAIRQKLEPAAAMTQINERFLSLLPRDGVVIFASANLAYFDVSQRRVVISSAGHEAPLWIRPSESSATPLIGLDSIDPALGLIPGYDYQESEFPLCPGEKYLFYTDGVIEAPDSEQEEFGLDRIARIVREYGEIGCAALNKRLMTELRKFTGTDAAPDDICLVAVGVLGF